MVKIHNPNFNRFSLIHACDGGAIAYRALSMPSRAKNRLLHVPAVTSTNNKTTNPTRYVDGDNI